MSDYKTYQSKLLHIALNDRERYKAIVERIDAECFDAEYRPIVQGIFHAHVSDIVLTANAYEDFIQRSVNAGDYKKWTGSDAQPIPAKLGEKRKFTSVQKLDNVKSDEFDFLMTKVKESYDRSQAEEVISKFATEQKGDFYGALAKLSEKANGIASSKDDATFKTMDLANSRKEWLDALKDKRANPEQIVSTGLKDIDECLSKSITEPGMLVFFVADVGGFKTTTMLNIALNVLKQSQENVMFVSLEMPGHLLMDKIISRESGVPGKKLSYPHLMTEQEVQRVERELDKWDNLKSKFIILDAVDGATVADIARAVEQHSHAKPSLVVVDYLTILKPEAWYAKLGQHAWFGYMCKSLRTLGKKHGFSIISAAQLGRDAIKRLKSQKEGSQTVGSEDIRGSHDLSADADALFIQVPLPSEPNEKIQVFCAKSRYGDKTFGGKNSVLLNVKPSVGRVSGERDAAWKAELQMQPIQAVTNYEVPIDINVDVPDIDPDLDIFEDDQPPISDSIFGDTPDEDSLGDGF
tara:strand:+ start:48168 stop:49733 length:1566 start_codon:yes stop_codon:yes gene_type:complete